jgi:Trk K+ transport system NAD-binding subunit
VSLRRKPRSRRFVVCGDSPFAFRLANELVSRFGVEVTVVVRSTTDLPGLRFAQLVGVELMEAAQLDEATLLGAGVAQAGALALVDQDDVGNIHAALRAYELNPDLRLVIRMFNMSLGHRVRTLFSDCTVLSDAAMAAPSFVAAALGELAPTHVRLPGRTLYVARRDDVAARRVVCGLADTVGDTIRLLPADQDSANLVLAVAEGAPEPLGEQRASRAAATWRRIRLLLGNNLVRVALVLTVLIVVGYILLATIGRMGFGTALYETLLDSAGDAVPDATLSPFRKVVQVTLVLAGLGLIPVVTAAVVDGLVRARLADPRPDAALLGDHVVVVGLGNVGTRVVSQLHDLGIDVVCIERNENARGVPMARRLGVPVVFGDATREDVLRGAGVATCRALLLLTSTDVVNLEAALQARTIREDQRVVLRLFDDDLAERMERSLGLTISRSVSRLAASAFAAAMMERRVISTMSIGRSVLMIAEVPVVADSPLACQPLASAIKHADARAIALQRRGTGQWEWAPVQTHMLEPQDRLIIVASRAGLGRVLASSIARVVKPDAS